MRILLRPANLGGGKRHVFARRGADNCAGAINQYSPCTTGSNINAENVIHRHEENRPRSVTVYQNDCRCSEKRATCAKRQASHKREFVNFYSEVELCAREFLAFVAF